jgi:hypothetical protein
MLTLVLLVFIAGNLLAQEGVYSIEKQKGTAAPSTKPAEQSQPASNPQPQAQPITTGGLIAYYPFNGNANDESGNRNNGDVVEAKLTRDRFGNINCAYKCGENAFIQVLDSRSLRSPVRAMSFTGWYNAENDYYGGYPLFSKSNKETPGQYQLMWIGNGFQLTFGENKINFECEFKNNKWYFVAFSWDGEKINFYLDGVLIGTEAMKGTLNGDDMPLLLGSAIPEEKRFFMGAIDDFRFFNRPISADEVKAFYREGK